MKLSLGTIREGLSPSTFCHTNYLDWVVSCSSGIPPPSWESNLMKCPFGSSPKSQNNSLYEFLMPAVAFFSLISTGDQDSRVLYVLQPHNYVLYFILLKISWCDCSSQLAESKTNEVSTSVEKGHVLSSRAGNKIHLFPAQGHWCSSKAINVTGNGH